MPLWPPFPDFPPQKQSPFPFPPFPSSELELELELELVRRKNRRGRLVGFLVEPGVGALVGDVGALVGARVMPITTGAGVGAFVTVEVHVSQLVSSTFVPMSPGPV